MPDSLSQEELRRLRAIYPDPPYARHSYQYSYFMGDVADGPQMIQHQASMRKLVKARTHPILRLGKGDAVSRKQPYVFYTDIELDSGAPVDDGWPYQSYYYLMGYDGKGAVALPRGSQVMVKVPSAHLKAPGAHYTTKTIPVLPIPKRLSRPTGSVSFVSLEGL